MKTITASSLAWLLVLAAVLWFGGNYLMDQIYAQQAQHKVDTALAALNSPAAQTAQVDAEIASLCVLYGHKADCGKTIK